MRGSRQIDFALASRDIADKVTDIVYELFLFWLKGNHRAFYFDINEDVLFQNKSDPPFRVDGRGISSKDCKNVTKYLEAVNKHLLENNVFEQMRKLMSSDVPNFLELEQIDRVITQACKHGENCCRKQRLAYWSVDLHVAKQDLSIWAIEKSRLRRKLTIDALIARAKSLGIEIDETTPKETINSNTSCLRQEVRSIHKNSINKRDEMLHDNANYSEDVGDKDKAKRLRQQKKEERKNRVCTSLKFIREKMIDGCGMTQLLVPASWPTLTTYDATVEYDLKDPKKVKDESA